MTAVLLATLDRSVRACARSDVVEPQRPVSSGVGRSAVPTFRGATIADGDGLGFLNARAVESVGRGRLGPGVLTPGCCELGGTATECPRG